MEWRIKVVPDDAPNDEGEWKTVQNDSMGFHYIPSPGYHIVAYEEIRQYEPLGVGNQAGYIP